MLCKCQGQDAPPDGSQLDSASQGRLRWPDFPCACCRLFDLWQDAREKNLKTIFTLKKSKLLADLKCTAGLLDMPNSQRLGTHAFRRGATQDMVNAGAALSTILRLGGWKSASVLHYMAIDDLENRNYALKCAEDSDSD